MRCSDAYGRTAERVADTDTLRYTMFFETIGSSPRLTSRLTFGLPAEESRNGAGAGWAGRPFSLTAPTCLRQGRRRLLGYAPVLLGSWGTQPPWSLSDSFLQYCKRNQQARKGSLPLGRGVLGRRLGRRSFFFPARRDHEQTARPFEKYARYPLLRRQPLGRAPKGRVLCSRVSACSVPEFTRVSRV